MAPEASKPFQLLEINVMSAQDLALVSRPMKTYARAWINPTRKLQSRVDAEGNNNPTWNDKFVFRVDEDFLREDTSAVMIEIYASHWLKDTLVGTVRVLIGSLIPPPALSPRRPTGMRLVALQVRRRSGRPQGILNIRVALLDGSMPMNTDVGTSDLMGSGKNEANNMLHRSRSERVAMESSIITVPTGKEKEGDESSIISISEFTEYPFNAELGDSKNPRSGSVISGSVYSKVFYEGENLAKLLDEKSITKVEANTVKALIDKYNATCDGGAANGLGNAKTGEFKSGSTLSDSEGGPSASDVPERVYPLNEKQSSVMEGWSLDESVEGLRSKLDRWRIDVPHLYDNETGNKLSGGDRRKKRAGSGLFSCFGKICGCECQCVCGKPRGRKSRSRR